MKENSKPRLLYFVEAMGGRFFIYIVDLANSLVDDWDVYIGYAVRNQTPQNYRDYFDERVHLIEVKNFARSTSILKAVKAGKEMKMIAETIRPDVIHLHSSIAGAIGRVVFNNKKKPVFYTPHGYSFSM
ncbi:glycosyltransferase [Lactobacillus delbrueckii subsp. bulgaricus]